MSTLLTVLVLIATFFVLVVIHELGHFLMAKKFRIKVLEFGFGIPPRIIGKKVGETLVSLNWLPLGGFVRLLGEDEVDKKILDDKRSFAAAPVGKKITVVVAGVVMNLILAWIIFYGVLISQNFKFTLPLLFPYHFVGAEQTNTSVILIGGVAPSSPASEANIKVADKVIAFNGQPVADERQLITQTKTSAGKPIQLTLSDPDGQNIHTVSLTPRLNPPAGQGALGVVLAPATTTTLEYKSWWQKTFSGIINSYNVTTYSFAVLGKTIGLSFQEKNGGPVSEAVAGPIGIGAALKSQIIDTGNIYQYFNFVALISLNLAIFNVLPFPGLDGGRLFFLLIEAITKKRTHPVIERYVHSVGLAILIGLVILVTISDVKKLF